MAPTHLTPEDDADLQWSFHQSAARSCAAYCANVVINSTPPRRFNVIAEQWQADVMGPMVPAFEQMAGLRSDYTGPRWFFIVLPKGHDKTSLIGRMATWAIGYARNPISASSAAGDRDQAQLIRTAMSKEIQLNPWVPVTIHNYQASGPGGKLDILAADAPGSSGRFDDLIVMDELTFWRRRDLFDMLISGAHKRPQAVVVIITNAGIRGSWQWQVLDVARRDPMWHVYEAPPRTQLASWLSPQAVASQRSLMTRNHARRVFDNIWVDATDCPLLSWENIERCHAKCLWQHGIPPANEPVGPLYVGFDVGRTTHRTSIATLEDVKGKLLLRDLKVMQGASFKSQREEVEKRLARREVKAVRIDKGGIGMQLAEELEARDHRVQGVACSTTWQGQAGLKLFRRFAEGTIAIPNDPDLNIDLQQVEEVGTGKGGVPILNTTEDELGHADRFWSIALAVDAVGIHPVSGATTGKPRVVPLGQAVPSRFRVASNRQG